MFTSAEKVIIPTAPINATELANLENAVLTGEAAILIPDEGISPGSEVTIVWDGNTYFAVLGSQAVMDASVKRGPRRPPN